MKTLNLIYPIKSDIQYEIMNFPDGQIHIKLQQGFNKYNNIKIICRICNPNDLFILMQIKDICKRVEINISSIYVTYMFTQRTDRVFSIGEAFDLKIVSNILKQICPRIKLIDCHSEITENLLDTISEFPLLEQFNESNKWICFPDEEAKVRVLSTIVFDNKIKFNNNKIITCSKIRAEDNSLSGFKINNFEKVKNKRINNLYVIDNLCDGGDTFLGIAEQLRKLKVKKIHLIVTHAIQKEGIEKVANIYDTVTISNSYKNWENEPLPKNVKVIDVTVK